MTSKYRFMPLFVGAVLGISGCAPIVQDIVEPTVETPLRSGIELSYMDTSVAPGDDFHTYVNGKWIAATEIPADRASYGAFTVLHEKSQADVRKIIELSAVSDTVSGSDEQKVGDLYQSYINMENRNALGSRPLAADFAAIDAISDRDQLAVYFARMNRAGVDMPFSLNQSADFKDPTTYMMYTFQGGLGLPDREYYFNDDESSNEIRAAYRAHIERMLELANIEDAGDSATAIYRLEERMAAEHMLKEKIRDRNLIYNNLSISELSDLMPEFNWQGYLAEAGVSGLESLVITQVDHMRALDTIIEDTPLDVWRPYLKWLVVNDAATSLDESFDELNFDFYNKTLFGVEQPQPRWRRAVSAVNANLGEVVGKVYVKEHFPAQAKIKMRELVQNLIAAYEVSIRELTWMSPETKVEALDKLSKFRPKIGYPDEWQDYSDLQIKADDLLGNLRRSAEFQYRKNLERQGGPVDRTEWAMTPQTVNAYYNPTLNEIVFPAAILQPPFFDLTAEDAVNYGGIGAVIGHEIGHGFDDSGSTFDGDGVLRNWWTDRDREEFEKRTARLVTQYSEFKPFDDLAVNGKFTLGENIGDLGGLNIALLAYTMSLNGVAAPVIDDLTGMQRVFIGYGQAWRQKYRDEALRSLINTDPHSPAMYRTNGAVRNIPEFYEAFDIAPEDTLYLAPEDRVSIW